MRDFDELLQGSFDAHAGQIDRAGGVGDGLTVRAVRDVRRKRAWRAGATGAVASVAAVGVVATAFAFTGRGIAEPAAHMWSMDDPSSLGPCTSYIPANSAVLPDGMYAGRAYVDPAAGFVVAVMPDGTVTRVQPGPDGDFPFDFGLGRPMPLMVGAGYPTVSDFMTDGSGGGDIWVDSNPVGWDWTVEPLAPAPAGVDVESLYATFAMTLGFGGMGYDPGAVPEGAIADAVAIYADGHEVSGALVRDLPAPSAEEIDFAGLEAMALRVTLADGHMWEIRADYTPENVPNLPCQPVPPSVLQEQGPTSGAMAPQSGEPRASAGPVLSDAQAMGNPLTGPEAAVFQCGMPLPADLGNTADVQAKGVSGEVSLGDPDEFPDIFDAGADGVVVEAAVPLWEVDQDTLITPQVPGWQAWGLGSGSGPFLGHLSLVELVALRDGVIVSAAGAPVEDWSAGGVGGSSTSYRDSDSSARTQGFISVYNGVHGLLQPCTGAAPDALDGAQLAVIYGFGPDIDHMTYGWTWVTG